MKKNIHPKLQMATITCTSCGFHFDCQTTKASYHTEVCYKCHPFYTGKQKFLNIRGRVDEFAKKQEQAKKYQEFLASKKKKEKSKKDRPTKSLKELLGEL
jgi:large subunit ribosomal protein L31